MKLKHHFIDETNFYFSFYEKQHVPSICKKISFNNTVLSETKNSNNDKLASKIIVLNLIPNYLNLELKKGLYSKKSTHKPGLAVNLTKGFNNIDDYLKTQCSPKLRKVVTRSVKRLESCFNIKYNMFYGHISKADCDLLMGKLYNMIENRFKQRSGRNTILRQWDHYMDLAFNGINKKTASLFVIFSNGQPIEISLNFIYDNIMFSYISSYDLDYAKFGLGHINYYKKVDWCIKNKIDLFDMGHGDFAYKRQWANMDYNFLIKKAFFYNSLRFFITLKPN